MAARAGPSMETICGFSNLLRGGAKFPAQSATSFGIAALTAKWQLAGHMEKRKAPPGIVPNTSRGKPRNSHLLGFTPGQWRLGDSVLGARRDANLLLLADVSRRNLHRLGVAHKNA